MSTNPTELGKKYIPLTENILLEYTYVADRYDSAAEDPISDDIISYDVETGEFKNTYGNSNNTPYYITTNKHINELFFFNQPNTLTNNNVSSTVLPANKAANKWVKMEKKNGVYYSSIDKDWSDVDEYDYSNLLKEPKQEDGEYIVYDIIKIYFQAGYHTDYDGFIFNVYSKTRKNKYFNLLSTIFENYDDYRLTKPFWFADKIYTNCVEYRIPSIAYLSYDTVAGNTPSMDNNDWSNGGEAYNRALPPARTLPYFLTSGDGFYKNPSIGFDLYGVTGVEKKGEFNLLKTQLLTSTLFPNKDSFDRIIAKITTQPSYYEMFGYYLNDTPSSELDYHSLYDYMNNICGTDFSLVHILTIYQTYVNDENAEVDVIPQVITFIQTGDMLEEYFNNDNLTQSPIIQYRPILKDGVVKASINYTLRITNHKDTTTIIKTSNIEIINPGRFTSSMINVSLDNVNDMHIYNRVEQGGGVTINSITKPLSLLTDKNTSAVKINNYTTSSFIDRRNVKVSVSPVKVQQVD